MDITNEQILLKVKDLALTLTINWIELLIIKKKIILNNKWKEIILIFKMKIQIRNQKNHKIHKYLMSRL